MENIEFLIKYREILGHLEKDYSRQEAYLRSNVFKYKKETDLHKKLEILKLITIAPNGVYKDINENITEFLTSKHSIQILKQINSERFIPFEELEKQLAVYIHGIDSKHNIEKGRISGHSSLEGYDLPLMKYNIDINFDTKQIIFKIEEDTTIIENFKDSHEGLIENVEDMNKLDLTDVRNEFLENDDSEKVVKRLIDEAMINSLQNKIHSFNHEVKTNIETEKKNIEKTIEDLTYLQEINFRINDVLYYFAIDHGFSLFSDISYPVPKNQLKFEM